MTEIHPIQLHAQPYEVKLYLNGGSYHLIFGRQINGWFLCIPNHQIGVELAHPSNQLWNQGSLEEAVNNPVPVSLLSGNRKPQICF